MIKSDLISFEQVKEILGNISEEQLLKFDGGIRTSMSFGDDLNVNVVELQVAFTPEKTEPGVVQNES